MSHDFKQKQAHDLAIIWAKAKFEEEYKSFNRPDNPSSYYFDTPEAIQMLYDHYMTAFHEIMNYPDDDTCT